MSRAFALLLIVGSCAACGLWHTKHRDDEPRSEDPAADGGTNASAAGRGAQDLPAPEAGRSGAAPPPLQQKQAWIGEVLSPSSVIFCDPEHPEAIWKSSVTDPMGFTWRTVLELDVSDSEALSGSVQFGELTAAIPDRPDSDLTDEREQPGEFWGCSVSLPVAGVSYRILAGRLTSERLELEFAPNQIWETWCQTEKPVCPPESLAVCSSMPTCVCEGETCHADLAWHFVVRLSRAGDTVEGHLGLSTRWGTPADIRLRRVK